MATSQCKVTAPALNVRSDPSIRASIIGEVRLGEVVNILESSGDWLKIQREGLTGWAFHKYLVPLDAPSPPSLITYTIISDLEDKLKQAAKISCNFWNRFLIPRMPIVMRLGTFTETGRVIARSYKPSRSNGVSYGDISFNTLFLSGFNIEEIVGTIIHELGHTLGFGWDDWKNLFDHDTGVFRPEYTSAVPALKQMRAETHGGDGTALSHWDEESSYQQELMTGFKDTAEYVLPVTIDVMRLLGHQVRERLTQKTELLSLIRELRGVQFTRAKDVEALDLSFFEETEPWEDVYTTGVAAA